MDALTATAARAKVDTLIRDSFDGDAVGARTFILDMGSVADTDRGRANVALMLSAVDRVIESGR